MLFGGTPIKSNGRFEIDFDLTRKSGFKYVDVQNLINRDSPVYNLSDDEFKKYFVELKAELEKNELIPYQLHSLWEFLKNDNDKEENWGTLLPYFKKAIIAANILGVKYVVLHHRFPYMYEESNLTKKYGEDLNIRFLKELLPCAIENNVILCLENLPFGASYCHVDGTLNIINKINSKNLEMCLDTGHLNSIEENRDIYKHILKIGKHLKCLHVHDNPGDIDRHLLPGEGNINWNNFAKGLLKIGFDGCVSLECCSSKKNSKAMCEENNKTIDFLKALF